MLATEASAETLEFLRRYYDAIDGQRVEEAMSLFAADATVRAANGPSQPWMQGLGAMARELRGVTGTRHRITRAIEGGDGEAAYEVDVTYLLAGGEEITLRGAVFCAIRDGLFHSQHLYVDLTPVRAALERAG